MYIDELKDKLACQIADATYERYQTEIYGLAACESYYTALEIESKMILKDFIDNYSKQLACNCNLDKIKDLR